MKKYLFLMLALFVAGQIDAQRTKTVHIFHTNDMHSRVEPYPDDFGDEKFAGKGGMLRREEFIREMRNRYPNVLLLDCGDFSQGTPYYNLFQGEVEVKMMNRMKYDAGTIGNHEFDDGLENMAKLFKLADFPIVCTNYDFSRTILKDLVKPYVILKRFGLKIGIFGLSPKLEGLVLKENYGDTRFIHPYEAAQKVATYLKEKQKCDLVICLSHLGWNEDEYNDIGLITQTRHIDVVLGGHQHVFFTKTLYYKNLDGKDIPVQQMGKSAAYVGEMVVTLQKQRRP